jgi:hypothetical protein
VHEHYRPHGRCRVDCEGRLDSLTVGLSCRNAKREPLVTGKAISLTRTVSDARTRQRCRVAPVWTKALTSETN